MAAYAISRQRTLRGMGATFAFAPRRRTLRGMGQDPNNCPDSVIDPLTGELCSTAGLIPASAPNVGLPVIAPAPLPTPQPPIPASFFTNPSPIAPTPTLVAATPPAIAPTIVFPSGTVQVAAPPAPAAVSWFSQQMIPGIPNSFLALGTVGLVLLLSSGKGRR